MINTNLLRGKIYERCENQLKFSEKIGWQRNKIGFVLKGKRVLNTDEICDISKVLLLTPDEKLSIFFSER